MQTWYSLLLLDASTLYIRTHMFPHFDVLSFQHIRKDLSTLKVYAIDVDEADEVCFCFLYHSIFPQRMNC
jgi:hypothetical protein